MTRDGYRMEGWVKNPTDTSTTDQVTIGKDPSGSTYNDTKTEETVYAYWVPIQYTVTYDYADGTPKTNGSYPTTNIKYDETKYVSAPTKEGFTFDGWTSCRRTRPATRPSRRTGRATRIRSRSARITTSARCRRRTRAWTIRP